MFGGTSGFVEANLRVGLDADVAKIFSRKLRYRFFIGVISFGAETLTRESLAPITFFLLNTSF